MRTVTHVVLGGAAGVGAAALAGTPPEMWPAAYVVGAIVAPIPNVDRLAAPLIRRGGWLAMLGRAMGGEKGQRGEFTHSLWALLGLALGLAIAHLLGGIEAWVLWAALGAYLSHILGDMWMLFGGVRLLAPFGESVVVPPVSSLRLYRGGLAEVILFLVMGFVGILLLSSWAVPRVLQFIETVF